MGSRSPHGRSDVRRSRTPTERLRYTKLRKRRRSKEGDNMDATPIFDHIGLAVPNLDEQVERLKALGMVVQFRHEFFALIVDPASGLKFELARSNDSEVHFRHLGFRTGDVDAAHDRLVQAGMETREAPHRRDRERMYTSYLKEPGGLEVQLVKYD
jgi:catechol 2,3-dioxygenase-like lactoylglutathione lyase family enzyme